MPLYLAAVLTAAVAFGVTGTAQSASPTQTPGAALHSWGGFDLLLVLDQEEFAVAWKQLNLELKRKRGVVVDDDILRIDVGDDAFDEHGSTRGEDRKMEDRKIQVHHRTDEWTKGQ